MIKILHESSEPSWRGTYELRHRCSTNVGAGQMKTCRTTASCLQISIFTNAREIKFLLETPQAPEEPAPDSLVRPLGSGVCCWGTKMTTTTLESIRVLIVDDHPVVRAGLTTLLGTQDGLHVVASASSGEEALEMLKSQDVDLVLLDLRMPGMNGIETLHAMRREGISSRVMILTSFETDEDIYRSVQGGAEGYLLKNTSQQEIVEAIRTVHSGGRYIPRPIASRLTERMMRSDLTTRELEILGMVVKGLTNKQIARVLRISSHTARNHVNSIIEKLDAADRTEAATTAIQRGIIGMDQ